MPKIKPLHLLTCRICFKKLLGKQREFCSDNCRIQNKQIKDKFPELQEKNPELNMIFWNQESNPDGKLDWKTIKGVENKPKYKIIKNIVTKKKGKPVSKELKQFQ